MINAIRTTIALVHLRTGERPGVVVLTEASLALLQSEMADKCPAECIGWYDSTMVDGVLVDTKAPFKPGQLVATLSEAGEVSLSRQVEPLDKITLTIKAGE